MATASPVIIDDGGSTRIKQIKDTVFMDRLIDAGTDKADGQFVDGGGAFLCTMKVRYHEKNGAQHIVQQSLAATDTVVIVSENQQVVTLTFDGMNRLVIALTSSVAGVDPLVEAKQQKKQRRYVVTNAGPISTVTVNPGPGVAPLYPPVGADPSIYTMVHLAPQTP